MFNYRYLARMGLQLDDALSPRSRRREHWTIPNILTGLLTGGRINATIVSSNREWMYVRYDGTCEFDLQCLLRLDAGPSVSLQCKGLLFLTEQQWTQLETAGSAKSLDSASYYLRMTAHFKTDDRHFEWLNNLVSIGTGEVGPHRLEFDLFELL